MKIRKVNGCFVIVDPGWIREKIYCEWDHRVTGRWVVKLYDSVQEAVNAVSNTGKRSLIAMIDRDLFKDDMFRTRSSNPFKKYEEYDVETVRDEHPEYFV